MADIALEQEDENQVRNLLNDAFKGAGFLRNKPLNGHHSVSAAPLR